MPSSARVSRVWRLRPHNRELLDKTSKPTVGRVCYLEKCNLVSAIFQGTQAASL
jgi:hypothetical protein